MVNYFGMFFLIFYDNWKIDILVLLKYIKYILIYSKWVIDINDILYSCKFLNILIVMVIVVMNWYCVLKKKILIGINNLIKFFIIVKFDMCMFYLGNK